MNCSGIIVSNVFLGMISKQLIDTDSSPFNHVCSRYFVQNMSISRSCSNHVIYFRWHATSLCDIRKVDYRAHVSCAKIQFASRSQSIRIIYRYSCLTHLISNIQSEPSKFYRDSILYFVT